MFGSESYGSIPYSSAEFSIIESISSTSIVDVTLHKLGSISESSTSHSNISIQLLRNRIIAESLRSTSLIKSTLHKLGSISQSLTPTSTVGVILLRSHVDTLIAMLRSLTATINAENVSVLELSGQMTKIITGSINVNSITIANLHSSLLPVSGNMNVLQKIAIAKPKPFNVFNRKIQIVNPQSSEPVLTQVLINGINLLEGLNGSYEQPSIDDILHGVVNYSNLGTVQNGSTLLGTSQIMIGAISNLVNPKVNIQIISGSLPPGLIFTNIENGSATISSTVNNIPISQKKYEFIIRVTNILNINVDRYFYFDVFPPVQILSWSGPYNLSDVVRGSSVIIPLTITNLLNLPLTYSVNPGLPDSLQIQNDTIIGVINQNISLSVYNFVITANDSVNSATSQQFTMNVVDGIRVVSLSHDIITWITTDPNLGSTYTTLPSHFAVSAKNLTSEVTYNLSPISKPLPDSLTLNSESGEIIGLTPFQKLDIVYNIIVRASTNLSYSDRPFYFTILHQFTPSSTILSASVPLEDPIRFITALSNWNPNLVKDDKLFRTGRDQNFGRVLAPKLLFGSRSFRINHTLTELKSAIQTKINKYSCQPIVRYDITTNNPFVQYYSGLKVVLGGLDVSPVYSPDGSYIYDIIYINVIDQQYNTDGYINGVETAVMDNKITPPVRIYPNSLNNMRQSYLSFAESLDIPQAGLPLWQRKTLKQVWKLAIELLYVIPGYGSSVLDDLRTSGFEASIIGQQWTTGRVVIDTIQANDIGAFILDYSLLSDLTFQISGLGRLV